MAITRNKKEEIVEKLKQVTSNPAVVFVNFHKLPVALATEIRSTLRQTGIGYFVAKKSLIRRAFDDSKIEGELPSLDGEIAVAFGEDPLAPAKSIYQFQKANADKLKIVGGVFEGKYVDASFMNQLATIPSQEVLYGQLVGMMTWPMRGLVVTLSQIAETKEKINS